MPTASSGATAWGPGRVMPPLDGTIAADPDPGSDLGHVGPAGAPRVLAGSEHVVVVRSRSLDFGPTLSTRKCPDRRYADSVAAGGVCSGRTRRTRAALVGRYQFQSPSSFISEGTSSVRITVASKMIPAARPMANTLIS